MASATATGSCTHKYPGVHSDITFHVDASDTLSVFIETDRLYLRSVSESEDDCDRYAALFGDAVVMEKYGSGTVDREKIVARIKNVWAKRWKEKDPYSGLAVFEKSTEEFLGHVVLGHGDAAGQSALAYLFRVNHWHKGFGKEAVAAVVQDYAPAMVQEGYLLDGEPLNEIDATARPDNPYSIKILERVGMHKVAEVEQFGAMRYEFSKSL